MIEKGYSWLEKYINSLREKKTSPALKPKDDFITILDQRRDLKIIWLLFYL